MVTMRATLARLAGARHDDPVAGRDACREATVPAKPRKSAFGRLTHCTGKRNGCPAASVVDLDRLEMLEQRRAAIPGMLRARRDDVVAVAGRHRDGRRRSRSRAAGELGEVVADVVEALLVEVDEVDLVDRQHDVADAEQRDDEGVAAGLGEDAVAGVDQEHGEVGVRGAGRHVAGVLLVARRVGDDEAALVGGEVAVGDVDGDALLALGVEAVDQQREVDVVAGGAEACSESARSVGELVLEQPLGVVEQPADQRRLAVVDAAAGEEAQQALVSVCGEEGSAKASVVCEAMRPSEIALALLLLHRAGLVVVDQPALPLRGARRPASRRRSPRASSASDSIAAVSG